MDCTYRMHMKSEKYVKSIINTSGNNAAHITVLNLTRSGTEICVNVD
jgi:hypothetical protein